MILVLVYWIYLLAVTSIAGISISRLLKIQNIHPIVTIIMGCFGITLFASIWSVFSGLGVFFEGTLIGICILSIFLSFSDFKQFSISLKAKIASLHTLPKFLFFAILIMAAAKCATAPYLIDNESYYIQSVKWLDFYGFVPGLGNLHPFLAQTSGWHILQSATNLDFIFPHFNDLSGFFLVIGNLYAFDALSQWLKTSDKSFLIAGLFPVFNVLLFQFISAPSPDMGVYVLFLVLFFEFWKVYHSSKENTSMAIALFVVALFALFIKATSLVFMLFPFVLFWKSQHLFLNRKWSIINLAICTLVAFLLKNMIISGYPFYPLNLQLPLALDWKMAPEMQNYIVDSTKHYAYFLTESQYQSASFTELVTHWLQLPKLHGLFNKIFIGLLLLFPLIIWRSKNKKAMIWFYSTALIQLVLLFATSPQYRFFLMFIFLLLTTATSILITNRTLIKVGIVIAVLIVVIPVFMPIDLNRFTENKFHLALDTFQTENIITPAPQTQYPAATFTSYQMDDSTFYTPDNIEFFWATGDGPLPCVQEKQLNYFKEYFKIIPQQRKASLESGFYSKNVSSE